jgi:transcription elongation GreA/GreB family factor
MKARIIQPAVKPKSIQFTKEGFEKAQSDFNRLSEERKLVLIRLQAAREMGDLSENGAYHAARFELSTIDRQLRKLSYHLQYGKITETKHTGKIDFGCKVTLNNNGKTMIFTLVNGFESDPKLQKLSVMSPIGSAIMGKKSGDQVTVTTPAGDVILTIQKVE